MIDVETLQQICTRLLDAQAGEDRGLIEAVVPGAMRDGALKALENANLEVFRLEAVRPFERITEALAAEAAPGNRKASFLATQSAFVARHFREQIEKFEDSACCADKTRTITRALFRHLKDGTPIHFNYDQEYTYHLPERIFREEKEIVEFFDALYGLYWGRPDRFVAALAAFEAQYTTIDILPGV